MKQQEDINKLKKKVLLNINVEWIAYSMMKESDLAVLYYKKAIYSNPSFSSKLYSGFPAHLIKKPVGNLDHYSHAVAGFAFSVFTGTVFEVLNYL